MLPNASKSVTLRGSQFEILFLHNKEYFDNKMSHAYSQVMDTWNKHGQSQFTDKINEKSTQLMHQKYNIQLYKWRN